MNSAQKTKKKISEYQIEDIKEIFINLLKKISSKIILLEIGNNFINVALAKSQKNKLYIKKVFRQSLPEQALDKSIPSDSTNFGIFLKQILNENKINTNRVAVCLPSDACYTRIIEIPEEINEDESREFLENPDSGIQIPISLDNSDFEIHLTNLPKKEFRSKVFNKYFLTSLPKKNVDIILDSIKNADLEISSIQMSHMCIANLLKPVIDDLGDNDLIISVDLLDEFTQFVIFDRTGPLLIKRLASIRNYPSIDEIKEINARDTDNGQQTKNQSKKENYHALSKLDVKVLLKEINDSYKNFLNNNKFIKRGKIFLSGRNSQHKNLVDLIGKSLKMDVALISPVNNFCIKEFSYNPDEINHFSMSRIIGLGLSLIKNNHLVDQSLNRDFLVQKFVFKEELKEEVKNGINNIDDISSKDESKFSNNLDKDDLVNEKVEAKKKKEEDKKELPPLPNLKINEKVEAKKKKEEDKKELPPLPNLKINEKVEAKKKKEENKKTKSFKIDSSFLKDD